MDGATEWTGQPNGLNPVWEMAFSLLKLLASRLFIPKHTHFCTAILIVNNSKSKNVICCLSFGPNCGL